MIFFPRKTAASEKQLRADDSYAAAYCYASLWHVHNIAQGWTHDQEADISRGWSTRSRGPSNETPADGFAPRNPGAYEIVSSFREYDAAIGIFQRALAAAPSHAMVWSLCSAVHSYMGEGRSAVEYAERGLRLSPLDTQAFFYLMFSGSGALREPHV